MSISKHLSNICESNSPTVKNKKNKSRNCFTWFGSVSRESSEYSGNVKIKFLERMRNSCMDSECVTVFEDIDKFIEKVESDEKRIDEFIKKEKPNQERLNEFVNKLKSDQLRKYDIIQYKCKGYFHWAIYIGKGEIVHLTRNSNGESKGIVKTSPIKYDEEFKVCRVNNLEKYAEKHAKKKAKGNTKEYAKYAKAKAKEYAEKYGEKHTKKYKEKYAEKYKEKYKEKYAEKQKSYLKRSEEKIQKDIDNDLKICEFEYNTLFNNCGHIVTFWKYNIPFNPESSIHTYITAPLLSAVAGFSVSALIGAFVFGFIKTLPHWGLGIVYCGCTGFIGIGLLTLIGLSIGAYLYYRYYRNNQLNKRDIEDKRKDLEDKDMKERNIELEVGNRLLEAEANDLKARNRELEERYRALESHLKANDPSFDINGPLMGQANKKTAVRCYDTEFMENELTVD